MVTKMFDIKIEILISNGKELQWSFESVWLGFGKPLRLKATGFSKLQLNLKKLSTSFFSVSFYVALWRLIEPCFTTINTDSYVWIFSRQTRPSSLTPVRQTTATDNQIRTQIRPLHPNTQQTIIRSDHQIRPSDHTTTATLDHQFRSPHQTTGHHPWLLSFQSEQQTQPLEMVHVRCILYGLGRGGYIELWMNLAKHTFHTRSAWSFRTFFRLNLIVVRLARGFPWAGKDLPYPFS